MDELLAEIAQLISASGVAIEPLSLSDPNNKWLVRSGLQKAIRRGQLEQAVRCASYLYAADPEYAWRSLAICLTEDVGLGWPDGVTFTLACTLKSFRYKLDEAKAFGAILEHACTAPWKTRSCCELSIWVDWGVKHILHRAQKMDDVELLDWATGDNRVRAYAAAATLRGRAPVTPKREKSEDGVLMLLKHIMETGHVGLAETRAAMLSIERPGDSMSFGMWPTLQILAKLGVTVMPDPATPEIKLKGIGSPALDMHCLQGKRALKAFHTSLSKDYPVIKEQIAPAEAVRALGSVVFAVEGGNVDKRLVGTGWNDLKAIQDATLMRTYGVADLYQDEVVNIVREELPRLNDKRKWVMEQ